LSTFRFGENWVICLGNVDGERKRKDDGDRCRLTVDPTGCETDGCASGWEAVAALLKTSPIKESIKEIEACAAG
jgi:hypothetical protein